jgi:hypothetical protein
LLTLLLLLLTRRSAEETLQPAEFEVDGVDLPDQVRLVLLHLAAVKLVRREVTSGRPSATADSAAGEEEKVVKREDEKRGEGDAPVFATNTVVTAHILPPERSVTLEASAVSAATRASNRRH